MDRIDKTAVRRSFNRAARRYDAEAKLQRAVANRLVSGLASSSAADPPDPTSSWRILDAGAGSGFGTEALVQVLPRAFSNGCVVALDFAEEMLKIARGKSSGLNVVCGDVEALPFADTTFDLAFSISALQWSDDLDAALSELRRVLKRESTLLLATYTDGTLHELQDSWTGVDNEQHVLAFPTPGRLRRAVEATGLTVASCRTQTEVVLYDDVETLLGNLKHTGVRNFRRDRGAGLTTRTRLDAMKARYVARYGVFPSPPGQDGQDGMVRIPASYVVTFVCAHTPDTPDGGC